MGFKISLPYLPSKQGDWKACFCGDSTRMGGEVNNQETYARVGHAMSRHGGILSWSPWPPNLPPKNDPHLIRSPRTGRFGLPKVGLKLEKQITDKLNGWSGESSLILLSISPGTEDGEKDPPPHIHPCLPLNFFLKIADDIGSDI